MDGSYPPLRHSGAADRRTEHLQGPVLQDDSDVCMCAAASIAKVNVQQAFHRTEYAPRYHVGHL